MSALDICFDRIHIQMEAGMDIQNISRPLQQLVTASKIQDGTLHATVIGSTGSITTIEYEPGVVADLKRSITTLAPPELDYAHERAWRDGNGHSHVQAALLGPSVVLPVRKGKMALGTWQQVVLINHDNKPRNRTVEITLIGKRE